MINILDLLGISDAVVQAFRTLFGYIAVLIYSLIEVVYRIFEILASAELLDSEFIRILYSKVGLILGLFMVFKLTFSLIQSLIDPNKLNDKKNGAAQIILRVVISIVLLGTTPAIFREAFKVQELIVGDNPSENVLYKLIVGSSTNNTKSIGRQLSGELFFGFYTESEEGALNQGMTDAIGSNSGSNTGNVPYKDRFKKDDYKSLKSDVISGNLPFSVTVDYLAIKNGNDYVIEVSWIPLLVVGAIVLYMITIYCIQIGIRVVQLAYLQLIAPIPILSYISDPEGAFKRWLKQCTTTYLDLFIRLSIIYFIVAIIGDVLSILR